MGNRHLGRFQNDRRMGDVDSHGPVAEGGDRRSAMGHKLRRGVRPDQEGELKGRSRPGPAIRDERGEQSGYQGRSAPLREDET